ncbi:Preprotein translocase band 1 subunit [Phocoenobacter uteri]|uniref:Protein-export membrane protein SecG n=1 Tax=Phocoenobacter uteri TaxID=146806 RepID=A0A379CA89_9PAST|nr:preprotein translocase subunit SecG [Phocoenobacter uteri]MDG6882494.1 preprotein translocase subunit SecG [Phocoenobacter uteri]SUB58655.1 Preprotein translocase band 1 subunit [Phocoenobacter uteri]
MLINGLIIAYLIVAIILIGFILMQQGKGADAGASFGAGASGTVFGSAGSANFLSRTTALLTIVFFGISLVIGNLNSHSTKVQSQFEDLSNVQQKVEVAPVLPAKKENNDIPQ